MEIMNKQVFAFKESKNLINAVFEQWIVLSEKAIREENRFTIALSGGKTPVRLYQKLTDSSLKFPWSKTHIFLADERFVALNRPESNYNMMKENLLDKVDIPKKNIHPINIKETVSISAEEYEKDIREFFNLKKKELPIFDLIMLGTGQDGHTASLFPNDKAIYEKNRLANPVSLKSLEHERVTLTLPVLNNARNIIFLVTGENKAEIVREIINGDNNLPASMVKPENGKVFFMLDIQAGSGLERSKITEV